MDSDGLRAEGNTWIVFYDGYCTLCSNAVQWIIRNDRRRIFRFRPIQEQGHTLPEENTLILVKGEKLYYRSTAVLHIAMKLRFPWPLFGMFLIIPPFIRDSVYRLVARKRKIWFGSRTSCYLP
jgi:predicted DCC family thiol-disulfide oxidoreductase YuxK